MIAANGQAVAAQRSTNRVAPEILDRTPPNDPQAERGVLGSILLLPEVYDEVRRIVRPHDFHDDQSRKLFVHMQAVAASGRPIDLTTVSSQFRAAGDSIDPAYLATVLQAVPHARNAPAYARMVREASDQRSVIHAAVELLQQAYARLPAADLEGRLQSAIDDIRAGTCAGNVLTYRRLTAAELDAAEYGTEYLVDWTIAAGQPCIVAGSKKTLKTSVLLDLAISLAHAGYFLGKFRVTRAVRVAMMSGESGMATLQETARRIAAAAGCRLADLDNLIISDQLPVFGNAEHIEALRRWLIELSIAVLIIDPAYLAMPTAGGEGSLFAMGEMLHGLTEMLQSLSVTLILAHHTKRGIANPFSPPELEDIAWAGFQEYARQWLLIGRRERFEPGSGMHRLWLNVGGSAGHSALWAIDVDEGPFDAQTPRRWELTVTKADEARREAEERDEAVKEERKHKRDESRLERNVVRLLDAMAKRPEGETKSALRTLAGLNTPDCDAAIVTLLGNSRIVQCEVLKGNQRTPREGFKLNV